MQSLVIGRIRTEVLLAMADPDRQKLIDEERAYALKNYLNGTVRELWGREDVRGGVLMIETSTMAEAEALVENLPFARAKLLDVEIIPLAPYGGFTIQKSAE